MNVLVDKGNKIPLTEIIQTSPQKLKPIILAQIKSFINFLTITLKTVKAIMKEPQIQVTVNRVKQLNVGFVQTNID